uniref:Uncharacterized protein n=1 Tax=Entomoneis paludosa TaxID=265537 RepID=A0A7S2Y606_9STRA|mmetsp:Transcript_12689/g.26302  ORF Transcript_12689/g.26302 Transcript_12689/m.26302 type:complete len:226 (+) Transcript_12689:82-759(+)|eukprot:CAMPEP_0172439140 /NCGR_PEP_ID=MMETSP1065-20121228/220_1 /TAXON_ID=265537 /ORGANISM="Amphiprora paludosa, Strain CCMP125" /LENGTH=225 /DNA_ID=CAMNT_0013187777 /DNA_START=59 /DNA_END=736 /DNA_ORIENTATION=-
MKLSAAILFFAASSVQAFQGPVFMARTSKSTALGMGFDLSGNSWKPDSEKMGSTDTGDFYPEDYDKNAVEFTEGMMGSQELLTDRDRGSPQLPGLENLGADAIIAGGINMNPDIPEGMEFVMSSVPDGEFRMNIAASGSGETFTIDVAPVCMTFEDYFAGFTPDSDPCFSVSPATGRMDRRGGEPTALNVRCEPNGKSGELVANLVINLPEDNSKICYKIIYTSF